MKTTFYEKDGEFVATIIDYGNGDVTLIANGGDLHQHFDNPEAAQVTLVHLYGSMPEEISEEEQKRRFIEANSDAIAGVLKEHKKRKTTTSTAVKARYNKKHYTRVPLEVPKELAEQFKKKCADEGTSCSAVLKAAIEEFLKK